MQPHETAMSWTKLEGSRRPERKAEGSRSNEDGREDVKMTDYE